MYEVGGAVDRVENPQQFARTSNRPAPFFAEKTDLGRTVSEKFAERLLYGIVNL
ncbi:MAG: hypothetical protein QOG10_6334 [Kribbellaceae bacterium]|jgi:hypothetical protein|nr:hypothetical protein [Kribbellaceae bacterium]